MNDLLNILTNSVSSTYKIYYCNDRRTPDPHPSKKPLTHVDKLHMARMLSVIVLNQIISSLIKYLSPFLESFAMKTELSEKVGDSSDIPHLSLFLNFLS